MGGLGEKGGGGEGACCCCALSFIAFMRRVRNSRLLCVYWCVITRDKLPSSFPHLLPTPPPPLCRVACSPFGTSNWPDSCSQINVSRWQLPPGSTTVYDSFARTTVAAQQQGAWPRGCERVLGLVKVLCCAPDALCR